jgi:hypothetical protein
MEKFRNGGMNMCCNILMCVAIVLIMLHILGYTNISSDSKEGMGKKDTTVAIIMPIFGFIVFLLVFFAWVSFKMR